MLQKYIEFMLYLGMAILATIIPLVLLLILVTLVVHGFKVI